MAIDRNSNTFTFTFAIVMVVVVGAALAITAIALKPAQTKNAVAKQMVDILAAVQIESDRGTAPALFEKHVTERIILDYEGNVVSEKSGPIDPQDKDDAFNVNVRSEFRDRTMPEEEKGYPIFKAEKEGKFYYIIPMVGKGLWGPVWGFMSLEKDLNTVYGAVFAHQGETPGLGAEISESFFQDQFQGKKIFDEQGQLESINVVKGGADQNDPHEVDGITGGTITSNGVDEMIRRTFGIYSTYFSKVKSENRAS